MYEVSVEVWLWGDSGVGWVVKVSVRGLPRGDPVGVWMSDPVLSLSSCMSGLVCSSVVFWVGVDW